MNHKISFFLIALWTFIPSLAWAPFQYPDNKDDKELSPFKGSSAENIASAIGTLYHQASEAEEARNEDLKYRLEYYNSLRNAGYDKQQAYEIALKGTGLPPPSED